MLNTDVKIKTDVIISDLRLSAWKRLAGYIDSDYYGLREKGFSVKRIKEKGYYFIGSTLCDSLPMIRVHCKINSSNITMIDYLGEDTDGYIEIQISTYEKIENFLNNLLAK